MPTSSGTGSAGPRAWPEGAGEMARRIRGHDWAATPLGPAENWSGKLKGLVELMLASPLVSSIACGPDRILLYNDAAASLYGSRHPQALGRPLRETFPEGYAATAALYDRVFAGEPVSVAAQPLDTRGEGAGARDVFDAWLAPVRDDRGKVAFAHMLGVEVGDRIRAEAALRASERRLSALAQASADVFYRMDPLWSELREMLGGGLLADAPAPMRAWLARYIPEEEQARVTAAIAQAVATRKPFELEHRARRADGRTAWILSRAVPVLDETGAVTEWFGSASDVSALKEAQEHEAALLAEVQHRVRNTLGVIRSIVRRTAATSTELEDYAMHLEGRIDAFARVQGMVARDPTRGVDLEYIVAEELRVTGAREGDAYTVKGPRVLLRAKAAETMSLAVHELATNAIKFGALVSPRGEIKVRWKIVDGEKGALLDFRWAEQGVSGLSGPPARQGFGTEMLTRTLPYELEGEAELAFRPAGLDCRIQVPLAQLLVNGEADA